MRKRTYVDAGVLIAAARGAGQLAERALDIIASEVKAGRCDPLLFQIFVEAEIWKRVL